MKAVRIVFLLLVLVTGNGLIRAQNLVLNPSFEEAQAPGGCDLHLECFTRHWADYFTTADYLRYNSAADSLQLLKYAKIIPRTGRAMAGGYQYGKFTGMYNREFIQGDLAHPLIAGRQYRITAWVAPHLQSPVIEYAVETIGFAVTDSHYRNGQTVPELLIPEEPEVVHHGGTLNKVGQWTKVSGCFRARGGESKLILGNFQPDSSSGAGLLPDVTSPGQFGSIGYYYFDDVSLEEVLPAAVSGDTVVCRGTTVVFNAAPVEDAKYRWSSGEEGPAVQARRPGSYTVTVTTPDGCEMKGTARLGWKGCGEACPEPALPSAFTPNGDGLNDRFRVVNGDHTDFQSLAIFNRWGQKLFHSYVALEGWDGRYGEAYAETGTYHYLLRYRDCVSGELKLRSGSFQLLR